MKCLLLACSLLITACAGDTKASNPDAMPAAGTFGAACTTVVDTGSTECNSGVCTNTFDQLGHPACSQKCTAATASTCPNSSTGMPVCNGKGYCKL